MAHKTFIYLLERKGETLEDDYIGFVITADTEHETRICAAEQYADQEPFLDVEDGKIWMDSTKSTCLKLGVSVLREDKAKVLMANFKAG